MPGSPFQKIWHVYDPMSVRKSSFCSVPPHLPGLDIFSVSVTFCMKMRPLSCNFGLPEGSFRLFLFLSFFMSISLQHSRIMEKR